MLHGCPPAARSVRTAVGSRKARPASVPPPSGAGPTFRSNRRRAWLCAPLCPLPERLSAAGEIVALIGMDLVRPPSWYSDRGPDRFDGLYEPLEDLGVVDVGPGQDHRERQTLTVDQEMALGARPTSVYRVRTGFLAPFFAGTQAESNDALDQSMRPSLPSLSSRVSRSACHPPARCQSRSRRQQVTPLHPNSLGDMRQGTPLLKT